MKLNGAFIGFGSIAEKGHSPTYASSSEVAITAVVEPSPDRQEAARAIFPSVRVYDRVEALLDAESPDFIDICTPPLAHAAIARSALARGTDVLCEKPLCLNAVEYAALAQAVRESGRMLYPVHNWAFAPILRRALEQLREGIVGRVWHVEIFVMRNRACSGEGDARNWRLDRSTAGGGITVDHGWHAFYLLMRLIGKTPIELVARMEGPGGGCDETARILVQFPESDGYIDLTWRAAERRNVISVQGSEGTLLVDDGRLLLTDRGGRQSAQTFSPLSESSHHPGWFRGVLEDFLMERSDAKVRGRAFEEAGWCAAMMEAAYASQASGSRPRPVPFPAASPSGVSS